MALKGEYVGRVYLTLTSKRQFVIDKVVASKESAAQVLKGDIEATSGNLSNPVL